MSISKKNNSKSKSKLVEILNIDTAESRKLYMKAKLNPEEKERAQSLLKRQFDIICKRHKGNRRGWAGDGGHAFFDSTNKYGASIEAAKDFLKHLPELNAQTARAFDLENFYRSVRIKAHRGEIRVGSDASVDSAMPKDFDDFLKSEKKLAPLNDILFITKNVYDFLSAKDKKLFQDFGKKKAGYLSTNIYKLKAVPIEKATNIFKDKKQEKQSKDVWKYLEKTIICSYKNRAARNTITKGLILSALANNQGSNPGAPISSKNLLDLTLQSLHAYLSSILQGRKIRVSYWHNEVKNGVDYLTILAYKYPDGEKPSDEKRCLRIEDQLYQVCKSFTRRESLATPCVMTARRAEQWVDYEGSTQSRQKRGLYSALQMPIFYLDAKLVKHYVGVLCIDANTSDTFLTEEMALWKDDLVGYLVNIALSEVLYCKGI